MIDIFFFRSCCGVEIMFYLILYTNILSVGRRSVLVFGVFFSISRDLKTMIVESSKVLLIYIVPKFHKS